MSGIFFEYTPGHLEVRFEQGRKYDYIELSLRMAGEVVITREHGDDWQKGPPVSTQEEPVEIAVYVSSVFCPFEDFIRFLEAITIDVQECGFTWEAEGPDGAMRWSRRFRLDTGFLSVEWNSRKGSVAHRTMLDTRQAVEALYTAFRNFVDSPGYDPLRYERVSLGDSLSLIVAGASPEEVSRRLLQLDAVNASQALARLARAARERSDGGSTSAQPIGHFFEAEDSRAPVTDETLEDSVETAGWDAGDEACRRQILDDEFSSVITPWSGANLRALRSRVIEDWLSAPWPAPRR